MAATFSAQREYRRSAGEPRRPLRPKPFCRCRVVPARPARSVYRFIYSSSRRARRIILTAFLLSWFNDEQKQR
jgi:hypothetical protein